MRMTVWALALGVATVGACNHEKVAPAQPSASSAAPPGKVASKPPHDVGGNQKMSHTLALSSDIVQLCGIKAAPSGASPKFAFDRADLSDDDHNVLQQLATCMVSGPLQGKSVESHRPSRLTRHGGVQPGTWLQTRGECRNLPAVLGCEQELSVADESGRARCHRDRRRGVGQGPARRHHAQMKTRSFFDVCGHRRRRWLCRRKKSERRGLSALERGPASLSADPDALSLNHLVRPVEKRRAWLMPSP